MDDGKDLGTPKTLDEAIVRAAMCGPLKGLTERTYWAVRDFMAQKFGAVYLGLSHDPAALSRVEDLFSELVKRPASFAQLKK